jgi:hypothetical protein
MRTLRSMVALPLRLLQRTLRAFRGAFPGGPGRAYPWEDADEIAARQRREREAWRQGNDGS